MKVEIDKENIKELRDFYYEIYEGIEDSRPFEEFLEEFINELLWENL